MAINNCGKPSKAEGGCDQRAATFHAGGNNFIIIISKGGDSRCEPAYTNCWQCWPSDCLRCLQLHKQGKAWGPFGCGECSDYDENQTTGAQDSEGASDRNIDADKVFLSAGGGSVSGVSTAHDPGMPIHNTQPRTESTDRELEWLYNITPTGPSQLDTPNRGNQDLTTSGGGREKRIQTEGRKPLPGLVPLFEEIDSILDVSPEDWTSMQDLSNQDDILRYRSIADDLDPRSTQQNDQCSQKGNQRDTKTDEPSNIDQRGEKEKSNTKADISAGGACLCPRAVRESDSNVAIPSKTTSTFLAPSPTREKPPSVSNMDTESDSGTKRHWKWEDRNSPDSRRTRKRNRAEKRLGKARDRSVSPDKTKKDGYKARSNKQDGGWTDNRRDAGYISRVPKMWVGNRQTRQYSPLKFPTAAQREDRERTRRPKRITASRQINYMEGDDHETGDPQNNDRSHPEKSGRTRRH